MSLIVAGILGEILLLTSVAALRRHRRRAQSHEAERFRAAEVEARQLAQRALIVEASMAELTELVIEETLREMGMEWVSEPF